MQTPITFDTPTTQRQTHAYILCLLRCAANEPGAQQHLEWLRTQFTPQQLEILDTLATPLATLQIKHYANTHTIQQIITNYENTNWKNLDNYPLGNTPDQPPQKNV